MNVRHDCASRLQSHEVAKVPPASGPILNNYSGPHCDRASCGKQRAVRLSDFDELIVNGEVKESVSVYLMRFFSPIYFQRSFPGRSGNFTGDGVAFAAFNVAFLGCNYHRNDRLIELSRAVADCKKLATEIALDAVNIFDMFRLVL